MRLTWHKNPDQALVKICRNLEEIRVKDGEKYYWAQVRILLKTDPWFMMRVALEWAWLDEDLVGCNFIRHVAENWGSDLSILLPRGHGKTLPTSAIVVTSILNDPNIAILEVSRTEDNANKIGAMVGQTLMENDFLQRCFGRQYSPEGFLPSKPSECRFWGNDGYALPWRRPRFDPTLLCISSKAAKAGKHPDWIWIDDPIEEENNNQSGYDQAEKVIDGCKMLVPAKGFFLFTGTRWDDKDTAGKIIRKKLHGKQGPFNTIKFSCYVDDNPTKPPTYPCKTRWNMATETGYTHLQLENMRKSKDEGGLGEFFDAQMRNDPMPIDRSDVKVKDINLYVPDLLPKVSTTVRQFGIEVTGGGLPIFNGFQEYIENLKIAVPLVEINNPKKVGVEKRDRIVSVLQPLVDSGKVYAQEWMIGDESATEGLGYELRRLGKAMHDDIADAFHNVPAHLAKGIKPSKPNDPCDLYIAVDLAWSEKTRSDWTVCMAVAKDFKENLWILDYDRFQISSPTGIYTRLLEFFQKFNEPKTQTNTGPKKKFAGCWR